MTSVIDSGGSNRYKPGVNRAKWIWAFLAVGLLAPVWTLSYFSWKQLKRQIREARENEQRSLEDARRSDLRRVAQHLSRRMEDRLRRALESARRILDDPDGTHRDELFAEPWTVHPFRLDGTGRIGFPEGADPATKEDPADLDEWTDRLDQAERREAAPATLARAVATYRDCLGNARSGAAVRRAASLLGALHLRHGELSQAAAAYERGWNARPAPIDPVSALLGMQRVVCQARLGNADACARAANEWLAQVLRADGSQDPWALTTQLRKIREHGTPAGASPTLLARQKGLWAELDRLDERRRVRQILQEWACGEIADAPPGTGLRYAYRIAPQDTRVVAFSKDAADAVGTLLHLEKIEAWIAQEIAEDAGLAGWRLLHIHGSGEAAPFQEIFPDRLPLWRLTAPAPMSATGTDAAERQILLGRILILSSAGVTIGSFLVLVWGLRKEWSLQQMKARFLSNVSHELRTPLSVIRTAGETLSLGRTRDAAHAAAHHALIVREAQRLTRMIENLLDFSRTDAGRRQYRLEPADLSGFLADFLSEVRTLHPDEAIRWETSIPDSLPPVRIDPEALRTALLNLIDNALKYSPGEKSVAIRARADGERVWIEVEDRGIGVPPAQRGRIFERFYRATNAEDRRIPGSGIGLSLVAEVAKAHGGTVELFDASPAGTRFRLSLPQDCQFM